MKKKILAMVLAVLMLLSLTACGGSGSSDAGKASAPEATSEPYVCEHYWQEATCTSPETCYSCGETQGEPAPHNYGIWSFTETEMSHSCVDCGESETQALDYAVAVNSYLEGNWAFYYQQLGDRILDCYSGYPGSYLRFKADGNGVFYTPTFSSDGILTDVFEVVVSAAAVNYDSEANFFNFALVCEDGSSMSVVLAAEEGSAAMAISLADGVSLFVSKVPVETKALSGTWTCAEGGELYILELSEDGHVSGNMGGEVTGEWFAMPTILSNSTWYTGFNIIINKDGNWDYASCNIWVCYESDDPYERMSYGLSDGVSLLFDDWYSFSKIAYGNSLEDLKAAHEDGKDNIVNTWTTNTVSIYDTNSGSTVDESGDYSITFNADGTFTSTLPGLDDATWSYKGARINGGSINCDYDTVFNGYDNYVTIYQDGSLGLSYNADSAYYGYTLYTAEGLAAQAEAEAASTEIIVGTWNGSDVSIYDSSKENSEGEQQTGSFSMTFNADGTVSASLLEDFEATWSYNGSHEYDGQTYYDYYVEKDGNVEIATVYENGGLSFSTSPDYVLWYSYYMTKN